MFVCRNGPESTESSRDSNAELFSIPWHSRETLVDLSVERRFGQDVRWLLTVVCMAILNPSKFIDRSLDILTYIVVYIPWDVEEYYSDFVKGKKDQPRTRFPNPQFGAFSEPLTVVDSRGRIVLWYLPGLLSEQHQVRFFFGLISY
jgi:hypothetical protein